MATWPVSLPQFSLIAGFERSNQPNLASFGTEVGPGKVRRRSTARTKRHSISMSMSLDQVRDFEEFYEDDLEDGALTFDLIDFVAGDTATWRFDPSSGYSIRPVGPALWVVSMTWIRLP